jgi:hypothetical protein
MTAKTLAPAQTLDDATPALDFEQPLESGDPRYVDLSALRGSSSRQRLRKQLLRKRGGTWLKIAYLSHRGAGKSTELLHLAHELSERYVPLYLEANVELDSVEIELEDLLLVLCRAVEERVRALGHPIAPALLQKVTDQFADIVRETTAGRSYAAELKTGVGASSPMSGFLSLTGHLTALMKKETTEREQVRQKLRQYPGALMEATNQLLRAARQALKTGLDRDLLIIVDNLDRYDPQRMDRLLVQQGDRFRELCCDLVVTPPISLLYRPLRGGRLEDAFRCEVMCSSRLRDPDQPYSTVSAEARRLLLDALGRRIDVDRLVPDEAAQSRLLVASGGSIRELLELAYNASLYADEELDLDSINDAVAARRSQLRDLINANGWAPTLATVARTRQVDDDDAFMDVLYYRLAFKYNRSYWYDIHPLVAEVPEVRAAIAALGPEE